MSSDSDSKPKENESDISLQKIECAYCKAPLELYSKSTKFKRCNYCGNVNYIVIQDDGTYSTSSKRTSKIGKFRSFGDLTLYSTINIDNVPYYIVGAMRYVSSDSVWYEFLMINKQTKEEHYLSYEDGQYILYDKVKKSGITRDLLDGKSHVTRFGTIEVYEKGTAKITEFDGEIPYLIDKDEKIEWFDGMIGKRKFSVEAVKDEFEVYFGDALIKTRPGGYRKGGRVVISKEVGYTMDKAKIIVIIIVIIVVAAILGGGYLTGGWIFTGGGGGGGMGGSGGGGGKFFGF